LEGECEGIKKGMRIVGEEGKRLYGFRLGGAYSILEGPTEKENGLKKKRIHQTMRHESRKIIIIVRGELEKLDKESQRKGKGDRGP